MASCQVIDYSVDPSGNYASFSGISSKDKGATIDGNLQLCLLSSNKQQSLDAYIGTFGQIKIRNDLPAATIFAYTERKAGVNKLVLAEISAVPAGQTKFKLSVDMTYPGGSEKDFPLFMSFDENHGVLYIMTRGGVFFLYEVSTGSKILVSKISTVNLIAGARNTETGGVLIFNANGQVTTVDTDAANLVNFIRSSSSIQNAQQLALNLSVRNGLPGSEQYYVEKFNTLMSNSQYKEAARVVANSPGNVLRNQQTIAKFKQLPKQEGKPFPLIQYFYVLLENTKLSDFETKEICEVVLSQNKANFVEKWLNENKITCTEQLGDLVMPKDKLLAARIYEKCGSAKAGLARAAGGDFSNLP